MSICYDIFKYACTANWPIMLMIFIFNCNCSNFQKKDSQFFYPLKTESHLGYSKKARKMEKYRYQKIREAYYLSEKIAQEKGWDKIPPHPTDYWFNLNLHQ